MKRLALITIILSSTMLFAQNTNTPWQISFGYAFIDIRDDIKINSPIEDYIDLSDINYMYFPSSFGLSRDVSDAFTIKSMVTFNRIKKGFNYKKNDSLTNARFFAVNLKVNYKLTNLFGDMQRFDPYLTLGAGYSVVDQGKDLKLIGGYGLNIWINDELGLQFESSYNHNLSKRGTDFYQHNIGLVLRFGSHGERAAACPGNTRGFF